MGWHGITLHMFHNIHFYLQSNSNYGKCLQNIREYSSVKLHTKGDSVLKAISSHTYKNYSIIDENLVQTNHFLPVIKHMTPIAIGVAILELSKAEMIDLWYNKLSNVPNCKIDLGATDTDSYIFKVSNKDSFWRHVRPIMDYSNYDPSHPLFDDKNKAKLGYIKNELAGKFECKEFVGLRSKCYSLLLADNRDQSTSEKKVCKGIGRLAIENRLTFNQYKTCLLEQKTYFHDFFSIRSVKHNLKTIHIKKRSLSFLDTKRYLLSCGIHSVPYGSYLIAKFNGKCLICK